MCILSGFNKFLPIPLSQNINFRVYFCIVELIKPQCTDVKIEILLIFSGQPFESLGRCIQQQADKSQGKLSLAIYRSKSDFYLSLFPLGIATPVLAKLSIGCLNSVFIKMKLNVWGLVQVFFTVLFLAFVFYVSRGISLYFA